MFKYPYKNSIMVRSCSCGEQFLFSNEILDDARNAYHSLEKVHFKMDALADIKAICKAAGRLDDLLSFCQEALNDPCMARARQDILYLMGEACRESDECDKALQYYLASMEEESPRKDVRYNRLVQAAFCWVVKGEPEKALELCKKAVIIDPDCWIGWKDLGMVFETLDDPTQAAECFSRAIRLSGLNIVPIVHLRELIKYRGDDIRGLPRIRKDLSESGVLV